MPYLSISTALAITSHLADPIFQGSTGLPLSLYQIIPIKTGGGKGFYSNLVNEYCYAARKPGSGHGIIKFLIKSPHRNEIFTDEEFGKFLSNLNGRNAMKEAESIKSTFLKMYDGSLLTNTATSGNAELLKSGETDRLQSGEYSYQIFGTGTSQPIEQFIIDEAGSGLSNRFLYFSDTSFYPDTPPEAFTNPQKASYPLLDELACHLASYASGGRPAVKIPLPSLDNDQLSYAWKNSLKIIGTIPETDVVQNEMMGRHFNNSIRIANLIHIIEHIRDGRLTTAPISHNIMKFSCLLANRSFEYVQKLISDHRSKKPLSRNEKRDKMLANLEQWMSKSDGRVNIKRFLNSKSKSKSEWIELITWVKDNNIYDVDNISISKKADQ